MHWTKLGHIVDPRSTAGMRSHAQVPTALRLDGRIRIYYADRDAEGRSFPAWVDVDPADPTRVLGHDPAPAMGLGRPGTFDDMGVMPGYAAREPDGRILLFYSGWNRGYNVPYHNATGLASSPDGDRFERVFEGPVMDRTAREPYIAVTPSMLRDDDGGWQAWYISGLRWDLVGEKYEPVYVIKHARSADGVTWERPPEICVPQAHPQEAFSHPTVLRHRGTLHMWFCARHSVDYRGGGGAYRMGYAWSEDGTRWIRDDAQAGLHPTPGGFDAEMTAYPFVLREGEHLLMFYNGSGFGRTGIGVARMPVAALER